MSNYINSEILDLLKSPNWLILSAQNPDAKKLSDVENASLHRQLVEEYRRAGIPFETVVGRYNGHYEDGIIIFTPTPVSRSIAAEVAKQYGQESVLTHEGLVYQDGSCHPVIDWSFPCAEPEDNYTLFRSTYFRANIDFEKKI
jgi:Protein of unknown function (DUF3293)